MSSNTSSSTSPTSSTSPHASRPLDGRISRVLFSESEIEARVAALADAINAAYASTRTLVVVGILKGSFMFLSDLVKRLTIPNVLIDFMSLSSYESKTVSTGAVRVIMDLRQDIYEHDVLIVEDIIDSGYTLQYVSEEEQEDDESLSAILFLISSIFYFSLSSHSNHLLPQLLNLLRPRQPKSLKVAVLLKKSSSHRVQVDASFIGFECPNDFVVGYGLDAAEFGRQYPFIGVVNEEKMREEKARDEEERFKGKKRERSQ